MKQDLERFLAAREESLNLKERLQARKSRWWNRKVHQQDKEAVERVLDMFDEVLNMFIKFHHDPGFSAIVILQNQLRQWGLKYELSVSEDPNKIQFYCVRATVQNAKELMIMQRLKYVGELFKALDFELYHSVRHGLYNNLWYAVNDRYRCELIFFEEQ